MRRIIYLAFMGLAISQVAIFLILLITLMIAG
jgi:hypothetical protein